ncbi:MAG: hypothetical protein WBP46_18695 [Thiolinea sp.]
MNLKSNFIELEKSACAKTNVLDIKGHIETNINNLLRADIDDLFITYNSRSFIKEKSESTECFEKRIHREIKVIIKSELSISSNDQLKYETIHCWDNGKKTVYFFYLSNQKSDPAELLQNEFIDKYKIFQALVELHLKLLFIKKTKEEYELDPVYFNSELYIATDVQNKKTINDLTILDTLFPEIFFSPQCELIIRIRRKTFSVELYNSDMVRAELDETQLLFRNKKSTYRANDELNTIQFSKKPFITFHEGYHQCINHAQNLVLDMLKTILENHNIPFGERYFKANFALDAFITANKTTHKSLVIIDNIGKDIPESQRQQLYAHLHKELKPQEILCYEKRPKYKELSKETNYLVLNKSLARNGSSISVSGKIKNTFWDAYSYVKKGGSDNSLDYYSQLKISRFESDDPFVLQGLNVDKLTQNKKDKNTGIINIEFKPISKHTLNRIKTELWLKERVFLSKSIEEIDLPNCKLTLVYVRVPMDRWSKDIHASIINITILNNKLTINTQKIFRNIKESRLRFECHFLGERKLFNDSFYMFDENSEVLLSAYNSPRIPLIIGNQQVDSLATAKNNNDQVRRISNTEETILPYYLLPKERKQYHHIYLQHQEHDLLYFVSTINRPKQRIEKQNLIYNILTFNKNGEIINALDQQVTTIYLKSFTDDILKVGEVSKSSLLEKIAKVFIEN